MLKVTLVKYPQQKSSSYNCKGKNDAFATYLKNIEENGENARWFSAPGRTKGFTENGAINAKVKATEIINWLKTDFDLGHGYVTAMYAYIKGKRE